MTRFPFAAAVPALLLAALAALLPAPARAASAAADYERFFGQYEGEAIADAGTDLSKRDLRVEIGPTEHGFFVAWTALITKAGGRTKRVSYNIPFRATRREHIFRSTMKVDMFGHGVPLDPLKGEPYVWAQIAGNVLTVYSMLITDEGGYEMQVYTRELVDDRMNLTYSRVRDGQVLRTVTGVLTRMR
jgi:hypothetical protein